MIARDNKFGPRALGGACVWVVLTAALLVWVFYRDSHVGPNIDNAWLLLVAKRLLAGEHLYTDILETNPPLIVWLNMIPAGIAQLFDCDIFLVFTACVSLLNVCMLWLTANVLNARKDNVAPRATFLYALFSFFVITTYIYGEREALFIALIFPYLAQTLVGPDHERYHGRTYLVYGLAGLGFAIKPFFLAVWGINELFLALRHRNILRLFSPGNLLIGGMQLVYWLAVYVFMPDYFGVVVPLVLHVYFGYNSEWAHVAEVLASLAGSALLVVFLARPQGLYAAAIAQLCAWVAASALIMLVQRKVWLNHMYVLAVPAIWCVWFTLCALWQEMQRKGIDIGRAKFTSFCLSLAFIALGIYLEGNFTYREAKHTARAVSPLMAVIKANADGEEVYPFAFNLGDGFPLIVQAGAQFHGSFGQLWPMSGLIALEQRAKEEGVPLDDETLEVKQFFLDRIVSDFTGHPPKLVWVNKNVNMKTIVSQKIDASALDIIAYLSQDARFDELWGRYQYIGEVKEIPDADDDTSDTKDDDDKKPETYDIYRLARP